MKLIKCIIIVCFSIFFINIGFSAITDSQWQELKQYYQEAKENTVDLRAKFDLAMAFAYTGFLQEGFDELSEIHKIDNEYQTKILEETTLALDDNPEDWKANFYHAFALYFNNRKDEATDFFYKVVELSPQKSVKGWALGYIAYIQGEKKQWKKALKIIDKAIRYEPDGVGLFLAKAYGQQQIGDYFGLTGTLLKLGTLQASGVFDKYNIQNLKNEK